MDMEYVNINQFNDLELASRMRTCNYEKYKSLVRMHLSFELELNTDEFDLACHEIVYEDKGKLKKWNRLSKKHRLGHVGNAAGVATVAGCAAGHGSKSVGNSPTECIQQQIDAGFQMHMLELKAFLMLEKNITQEGLFRKTGAVSRQNELRLHIQQDKPLELEQTGFSAHDCATVFKSFLAELPEPLLTDAHYPAHLQIAPLCQALTEKTQASLERQQHLLHSVQLLILLLPDEHRELLQHIIEMLHAVAQHEDSNKMSAENLATVFTPHLICPRNLPPEVLHYTAKRMSSIIAYMITRNMEIFAVPAKLATDIRAYFLERKRKKTMSPEQTLDESISDISTVNTVYTFVDRAATAAATNTNNTDTELAQLYAHIQSLPESSKKRRLIKQFNKQNGQGTPLQLVVMNRLKNNEATRSAKSLSDSIKKHIFHKSLMSRTPKRAPGLQPLRGSETPNLTHAKTPKLRVLFQSPTPAMQLPTSGLGTKPSSSTSSASSCGSNTMHTLHKSISSTSLKIESSSDSSSCGANSSHSAPVSRQQSHELATGSTAGPELDEIDATCCVTPAKIISAVAQQLIGGADKKTVAWNDRRLLEIEEYSNPCTPVQQSSRYKSEPNLCSLRPQVHDDDGECDGDAESALTPIVEVSTTTTTSSGMGKSITRKLMKGVSMGNLRFPFSTPETTKRLVRSVSATLKRRPSSSDDAKHIGSHTQTADAPLLEDVDDSDLEDEDGDADDDTLSEINGSSNELPGGLGMAVDVSYHQQLLQSSVYRNLDLITSTPALRMARRSMSPITKSTQRMPKAMQESIMTPRSRKPVMLLTALGNADKQQNQSCFLDQQQQQQDDEVLLPSKQLEPPVLHSEDATSLGGYADILRRQQSLIVQRQRTSSSSNSNSNDLELEPSMAGKPHNALSNDFKEYLLTRSVLTASPADSSFASRSDDFGGANTTQDIDDIEDFEESELSPSLLYCLDGNEPATASPLCSLNIGRKRSAGSPLKTPLVHDDPNNKENLSSEHLLTKKLLITSTAEYPGETAL
ncbi:uncharacterized protein LOC6580131 isoform X2 [Drosophila mojavensis]|uniref:Rho-GAP domain-containing protein n=1 Tax=Drosophila mojavensis TaxID=7230 RepID=B4KN77_DROMO|nr:uncharacterized protein LOC6580131 isoform X2 [Drosophila mojavensis]EDW09930.1 uncharacterized protein Dmoj_GI20786 [Drosophila mojavensis]